MESFCPTTRMDEHGIRFCHSWPAARSCQSSVPPEEPAEDVRVAVVALVPRILVPPIPFGALVLAIPHGQVPPVAPIFPKSRTLYRLSRRITMNHEESKQVAMHTEHTEHTEHHCFGAGTPGPNGPRSVHRGMPQTVEFATGLAETALPSASST